MFTTRPNSENEHIMKIRHKKPLYRKVNTRTHGVWHGSGSHYRYYRNTSLSDQAERIKMKQGVRRGLDYTPLFRFLQSKVGRPWNEVHSEAASRLDNEEPIFWLVAKDRESGDAIVFAGGENSYFNGLYIDDNDILQIVAPHIGVEQLTPDCPCCTHTLNGKPFTRKYKWGDREPWPE